MPSILRANCLIAGDSTVGKSSICQAFQNNNSQFLKNYTMTTSMDISSKLITLPEFQTSIEIFLLDTSGKDIFYELNSKQFDKIDMLVLVYDITSQNSFNSIIKWIDRTYRTNIPSVLVANKTDLDTRRSVTEDAGRNLATSHHMHYVETSVKDMINVNEIFQLLVSDYCGKFANDAGTNGKSSNSQQPRYEKHDSEDDD